KLNPDRGAGRIQNLTRDSRYLTQIPGTTSPKWLLSTELSGDEFEHHKWRGAQNLPNSLDLLVNRPESGQLGTLHAVHACRMMAADYPLVSDPNPTTVICSSVSDRPR